MSAYRNPIPTVDIIIEIGNEVVLIERANEPKGFAIPGGFLEEGESAESAAVREAKEETGLDVHLKDLFYVYSKPGRDPRMHTVSIVYIGEANGIPKGGDDAKNAILINETGIPDLMAFDHRNILNDYYKYKKHGTKPDPSQNI